MFKRENISYNIRVACFGKTNDIWHKQTFLNEFTLMKENPLDFLSWKDVDIGFLIADASNNKDVNKLKKTINVAKETDIRVLIPIVISEKSVTTSTALLTINPQNYEDYTEIYKEIYYVIKSIKDIVYLPGFVMLNLQDVQTVCKDKKNLMFAIGEGKGEKASLIAVKNAINKLTRFHKDAKNIGKDVLLNVIGNETSFSMYEIQEVSEVVSNWLENKQGTIIWGGTIDNSLNDIVRISILIGE